MPKEGMKRGSERGVPSTGKKTSWPEQKKSKEMDSVGGRSKRLSVELM
jgi:hypothetical protein